MKLTIATGYVGKRTEVSIADAIEDSCDDYLSEGRLETVASKVDKTAKLFGQLVQALYENKQLTNKQIADMLSYRYQMEND